MLDLFFTPLRLFFLFACWEWFGSAGIVFRMAPRVVTSVVVSTRIPEDEGANAQKNVTPAQTRASGTKSALQPSEVTKQEF
jgi:hypothetical protein